MSCSERRKHRSYTAQRHNGIFLTSNGIFALGKLDPVATDDLCVCHETDLEVDVGLEGPVATSREVEIPHLDLALVQQSLSRRDESRNGEVDLDEVSHLVSLEKIKNV